MSQPGGPAAGEPARSLTTESVTVQIGDIVEELLGRRIDPDQNFFEAGLSSLTVTRLQALVSRRLGVEIPETGLFSHPNLRGVAALVVAAEEVVTPPARVTTPERPRRAADARRDIRAGLRRRQEPR